MARFITSKKKDNEQFKGAKVGISQPLRVLLHLKHTETIYCFNDDKTTTWLQHCYAAFLGVSRAQCVNIDAAPFCAIKYNTVLKAPAFIFWGLKGLKAMCIWIGFKPRTCLHIEDILSGKILKRMNKTCICVANYRWRDILALVRDWACESEWVSQMWKWKWLSS